MTGKMKTEVNFKHCVKRVIALLCVACFVFVFLFSAVHFVSYNRNAGEIAGGCQRTLMPECRCETGITQLRMQIQARSHMHNDSHIDCFVCVIVSKIVDQTRQFNIIIAEILLSDISLLVLIGSCLIFIPAGFSTPVELKTRTNN